MENISNEINLLEKQIKELEKIFFEVKDDNNKREEIYKKIFEYEKKLFSIKKSLGFYIYEL